MELMLSWKFTRFLPLWNHGSPQTPLFSSALEKLTTLTSYVEASASSGASTGYGSDFKNCP